MSTDGKFILDLEPNIDREGRKYYVAKIKSPIWLDCRDGVAFLCFIAKEGEEELHICPMKKPKFKVEE